MLYHYHMIYSSYDNLKMYYSFLELGLPTIVHQSTITGVYSGNTW